MRPIVSVLTLIAFSFAALAASAEEAAGIAWRKDLKTAMADAAKENKLIFMDIYAEWCPPCKMMDQETFPDAGVQKLLAEFIPVKIDADKDMETVEKYSDGSLPTLAVLEADGRLLDSQMGAMDPATLIEWVGSARNAGKELARLEAELAANPGDVTKAMDLAARYMRVRQGKRAVELLTALPKESVAKLTPPNQAQYFYTRGLAEFSDEQFEAGVQTFGEFATKFPQDPRSAEAEQYILQGSFRIAGDAFRAGKYDRAKELYTILAQNTEYPGVAEQAKMEIGRIELLGKPAPELDLAQWLTGGAQKLADHKGKVVVLDFIQVVDPNSEVSRTSLTEQLAKHGDKLAVIGVVVIVEASEEQTPENMAAFLKESKYPYPVGLDKENLENLIGFSGMGTPWAVILDKSGNIAYSDFFDADRVPQKIEELLK